MVEANAGLNAIRDFIQSEVAEVAVGTGTTEPKATDESLENEVTRKSATASAGATGEVTHTIRLSTSEANDVDLSEVGTIAGDGDLTARETHSALSKDSTIEVEYRFTHTVRNP